jgi:hypothetical protein
MSSSQNTAKFTFFYLLSLVSLIFTAIGTGMIIFQIINKFVPDIINQYSGTYSSSTMRTGISMLVIAAPIFFLLTRQIHKYLFSGEMAKDAFIRKWLTYFIMLITSVVMIGWLIGVINSFLDGELTAKFMLKAATALGIAALIFGFYLYDMRREFVVGQKDKYISYFAYGALALVSVAFVSSLFVVESPAKMRAIRLDAMVIEDFSNLQGALNSYYSDKKSLPDSLETLRQDYNFINEDTLKDPETGQAYGYRRLEDKKYELCATFRYSNKEANLDLSYMKDMWPHDAGEQCISQKVEVWSDAAAEKLMR